VRKASALIATAALLAAALTGCSASGTAAADCKAPVKSGAASELIDVTGDFGAAPTVTFPTPLKTKTTERSQIIEGSGDPLVKNQMVKVDFSVYNGTSGKLIEATGYDGEKAATLVLNDNTMKGLVDGILCTQVGERVAVAVSPADGFGPQGGQEQLGVTGTDSLVFVIDVVKAYLPRANGADQPVESGLPSVVLDSDGVPGITIPSGAAPTKLTIGVLKKGDGATVKEGDTVTVQYTGVVWDTKKVFDSSWEKGTPAQFVAADGSKVQGGVIPGFADALIGQTVGSQVIAVIPPDQGYGDQESGTIPANSTLVFVVDILGVN
jgi:FKBP-type peptidyl-prolyl cis-trans isomerase